jgi:hypothetical protein
MTGNCELCHKYGPLETHHIFNGAYKKKSEKYGAMINLCHNCHNEPPNGVHHNAKRMNELKAREQKRIMAEYGFTTEEFIYEFGKSYIDDATAFEDLLKPYREDIKKLKEQISKLKKEHKRTGSGAILSQIQIYDEMLTDLYRTVGHLKGYYNKK